MKPMSLPKEAEFIIDRLESVGYTAYVVGGAVRDSLLSRPIGDYDITTSATPERVKELFSDCRTVDTGIKHGTVSVVLGGVCYEVTTYRIDGEYLDSRHPESVVFTDRLSDDLSRRDFTVNAIAYNPTRGYADLFGGLSDAKEGIIRAVGDPVRRFEEDALRIMRAVRFASVLDFTIEEATARAARELCSTLCFVSRERVFSELMKLFSGKGALRVLSLYPDIIAAAVPELAALRLPCDEHCAATDGFTLLLATFAMTHNEPAEHFDSAMRSLRSDNARRICGRRVLESYKNTDPDSVVSLLTLLSGTDEPTALQTLKLLVVLGMAEERHVEGLDTLILSGRAYKIKHLALRGNELATLGISGEDVGTTLSMLLHAVITEEVENEREALLKYASEHI